MTMRLCLLCFTAFNLVTSVTITITPSNVTAFRGDDVTLECGTGRQKPGELVIWKKISGTNERIASINNRSTNSYKFYIRNTYNLVIRDVTVMDDGLYQCDAETNTATAYVSVSVPMERLTLTSDMTSVSPSDGDVNLTCRSWHSHPPADLRWFKGQRELNDITTVTSKIYQSDGFGDCESTITVRMRSGEGDIPFRCVADLPAKTAIKEVFLFPRVTSMYSTFSL
ncbi:cell adhesion molecule 2-like [Haliotis rubra]|uniref:cell adhesion molecule 2-like n=1 Tax=Haliotis rubra TaxID=36100 RepID=UPI001EE5685F|nr:cell adhesion molecule 2-like [Haliotis rubra]